MGIRANQIGTKLLFPTGITETVFTNADMDAIANATTNSTVKPHAYTATLATQYDVHNWASPATGGDITAQSRIAFGCFLSSDDSFGVADGTPSILYSCKASLKFTGIDPNILNAYPIFGRCSASTVTSTVAANANTLSSYIVLPHYNSYINNGTAKSVNLNCDTEVIKIGAGNPVFFGWVIDNPNAALTALVSSMYATVCFQKNIADIPCFSPLGR